MEQRERVRRADLHTHTTASDGTCTPTENVRLAQEAGLAAVAITDHDTVAGISEALAAGKALGVEVVPGVEISTFAAGQDIHVLGYFVPYTDPAFRDALAKLRDVRHKRNEMLITRLRELGIRISLEDVYKQKEGEDKNIGRPHIAAEMLRRGYVKSIDEAFAKYLGKHGAAYVSPPRITPQQAIDLIQQAGGVAVLAHPGLYDDDKLVEDLIGCGLDGLEVWHPDNDAAARERYFRWTEEYGLVATGGSDFHGWRDGQPFHAMIGSSTAALETVVKLKERASRR